MIPKYLTPEEFKDYSRSMITEARDSSKLFAPLIAKGEFKFYCSHCDGIFNCKPSTQWNLRGSVRCSSCGFGGRTRHLLEVVANHTNKTDVKTLKVALFEEVTQLAKILKNKFANLLASEYIEGDHKSGDKVDILKPRPLSVTHQNIQSTSYDDQSLDLIIHADVWEHIPSIEKALQEAHRILKSNGLIIFTMPLYDHCEKSKIRAVIKNDGTLEHIHSPDYHGNPLSKEGALVFTEPGFDFFRTASEYSFSTQVSLGFDPFKGYFPDCAPNNRSHCWNLVFILKKT